MIRKKRLIDITRKLIRYDSVNPPGNERALAAFIESDMRSLGLDVRTYAFRPERPNVVATLAGTRSGRTKRPLSSKGISI